MEGYLYKILQFDLFKDDMSPGWICFSLALSTFYYNGEGLGSYKD